MSNIRPLKPELAIKAKKTLNEDETRIKMSLLKLKQWLQLQPHLKIRMDDQWLIAFLRGCDYSLERVKETIDSFLTLRNQYSNVFRDNKDPKQHPVKHFIERGDILAYNDVKDPAGPVYYLARSMYDPAQCAYDDVIQFGSLVVDILLYDNDNMNISGVTAIFELGTTTMAHVANIRIDGIKKILHMLHKGYPLRVQALHFVNAPSTFKFVYDVFKMFAPQKLQERFFVHTSMEELYEHVPQEQLPKDYGGKAPSIAELMESWKNKFDMYRDWLIEDEQYCADESLRPENSVSNANQCSVI